MSGTQDNTNFQNWLSLKDRDTKITPDVFDYICGQIQSGRTLRSVCREPGMPDAGHFVRMTMRDPDAAQRYAHARVIGFAAMAEDILEIADGRKPTDDDLWLADPEPEGSLKRTVAELEDRSIAVADALHPGAVARDKLRIDARKWILSKMLPKIYGDRNFQTGEGGTKGEPLQVEWQEPVDR
jgi:hypothetical protein